VISGAQGSIAPSRRQIGASPKRMNRVAAPVAPGENFPHRSIYVGEASKPWVFKQRPTANRPPRP